MKFFTRRKTLNPNDPDSPEPKPLKSRSTLQPDHLNRGKLIQAVRIPHRGRTDSSRSSQPGSQGPGEPSSAVQLEQDDLGVTIIGAMNKYEIGLDSKKSYLPDAVRLSLIDEHSIRRTLIGASPELVKFIADKASKTFAITILAIRDSNKRLLAMEAFHRHGFTDKECLPVEKLIALGKCENGWKFDSRTECGDDCTPAKARSCVHSSQLDVFHHSCWDYGSFNDFYREQWGFLLHEFDLERFEYDDIDEMVILPFILRNVEENERAGNFGDVLHADMLAEMLVDRKDLLKMGNPSHISVAIKTLKPPPDDPRYDIPSEWKRESNAHRELNDLKHGHIITALAAFRQGRKYHLLLEWANGESLKKYWKKNPRPDLDKDSVKILLKQLIGLADALYCMHLTAMARRRSISRSGSRSGRSTKSEQLGVKDSRTDADGQIKVANVDTPFETRVGASQDGLPTFHIENMDEDFSSGTAVEGNGGSLSPQLSNSAEAENWRHGDIKPDNILRFVDESDSLELGTLKLADLGRAKQNIQFTRNNPLIEWDVWRSRPYEPPDISVGGGTSSMSRLYDIWSLGCVFFESIIWMLYGYQYQQAFVEVSQTTRESKAQGSPYWTRIGRTAKVSDLVSFGMTRIFRDDPGCRPKESALGDVLKLVQEKLLVVDLPEDSNEYTPGRRTNAEDLRNDLDQILKRAEEDDEYAWTTEDRSKVVPPSLGAESTPGERAPSQQSGLSSEHITQQSLQLPPVSQGPQALTVRRHSHYTHFIDDKWLLEDDDTFAKSTVQVNVTEYTELYQFPSPTLCPSCERIDISRFETVLSKTIPDMSSRACSLCTLLHKCARRSGLNASGTIIINRVAAGLSLNGRPGLILRVCRSFRKQRMPQLPPSLAATNLANTIDASSAKPSNTRIGLPQLPKANSKAHINILRSWLKDCDTQHTCIPKQAQLYVPIRLLDINPDDDLNWESNTSQVVETKALKSDKGKNLEYVALSHPWGDPKRHNHFFSDPENIETHLQGIDDDELPATFYDAVKITRQLKKKYLWIDSLCILQGPEGDFQAEAGHMQDIFSSAYCVLAASSADGMTSGFLKRRTRPKVVALKQDASISQPTQDKLYICETLDDFQNDVIESPLNQRGWVLQERALARRTIYFTANQTYWECSNGIRCETLTKMKSKEAAFLGDSNFPSYAVEGKTIGAQLYLFTRLYEQYSHLSLSHLFDKPIAISGLEQRLTKVFDDHSGAGVFKKRWGRFLLWTRAAPDVVTLSRIAFTATPKTGAERSPTWSWMAYDGGISFSILDPPGGKIVWDQKTADGLFLTGTAATSWLHSDKILSFKAEARDFSAGTDSDKDETSLIYDIPQDSESHDKKCVLIGRWGEASDSGARHYVLLVSLKSLSTSYERIGAGYLPGRLIKGLEKSVEIVKIE